MLQFPWTELIAYSPGVQLFHSAFGIYDPYYIVFYLSMGFCTSWQKMGLIYFVMNVPCKD